MKVRVGAIAVLLVIIVGFAMSASACEKCKEDQWKVTRCSSGETSGAQSCWGGSGEPCVEAGGSCGSSGPGEVLNPTPLLNEPCLSCSEEAPRQGFVLRSELIQQHQTGQP